MFEGRCYRIDRAAKFRRHARDCALASLFQFERSSPLGRDRTLALALGLAHQFKEQIEICLQSLQVIAFSRSLRCRHGAPTGQSLSSNFASGIAYRLGRDASQFDDRFNQSSIVQREGAEAVYLIPRDDIDAAPPCRILYRSVQGACAHPAARARRSIVAW